MSKVSCIPMNCSTIWRDLSDNGWRAEHDEGNFTSAVVTMAQVVQGGNEKWTPWIVRIAKGRLKKVGQGRIQGTTLAHHFPGQFLTKAEAFEWVENKWVELAKQNIKDESPNNK